MTRTRPTIDQLERHPGRIVDEFRRASEELIVAKTIELLLETMPVATKTVVLEMAQLLQRTGGGLRAASDAWAPTQQPSDPDEFAI